MVLSSYLRSSSLGRYLSSSATSTDGMTMPHTGNDRSTLNAATCGARAATACAWMVGMRRHSTCIWEYWRLSLHGNTASLYTSMVTVSPSLWSPCRWSPCGQSSIRQSYHPSSLPFSYTPLREGKSAIVMAGTIPNLHQRCARVGRAGEAQQEGCGRTDAARCSGGLLSRR